MKRLIKKAEYESIKSSSYDFKILYDKTNNHLDNIEDAMNEIIALVDKSGKGNMESITNQIGVLIEKIYRESLDSYSKINVSKDLSMDNVEQLQLSKEKISEIQKKLDNSKSELESFNSNHKKYSQEINTLKEEILNTKDLLDRMEKHLNKESKVKNHRIITSKRKTIIKNIHHEIMESFNKIMETTHDLEKIRQEMISNGTLDNRNLSLNNDLSDSNDICKIQFEKIFKEISSNIEDIKDDMEVGLDLDSSTNKYIDDKNSNIEELYQNLKSITDELSELKMYDKELADEHDGLKYELDKLKKMMMI